MATLGTLNAWQRVILVLAGCVIALIQADYTVHQGGGAEGLSWIAAFVVATGLIVLGLSRSARGDPRPATTRNRYTVQASLGVLVVLLAIQTGWVVYEETRYVALRKQYVVIDVALSLTRDERVKVTRELLAHLREEHADPSDRAQSRIAELQMSLAYDQVGDDVLGTPGKQ